MAVKTQINKSFNINVNQSLFNSSTIEHESDNWQRITFRSWFSKDQEPEMMRIRSTYVQANQQKYANLAQTMNNAIKQVEGQSGRNQRAESYLLMKQLQ